MGLFKGRREPIEGVLYKRHLVHQEDKARDERKGEKRKRDAAAAEEVPPPKDEATPPASSKGAEDQQQAPDRDGTNETKAEVDKTSTEWTGADLAAHARAAMKQKVEFTFGFDVPEEGNQGDDGGRAGHENAGGAGAGGAPGSSQDSRTVYVGGLPYEVTDVEVEQYFSEYGQVERIDKLTFNDSGRFNGIAFVTFDSGRSAKKALQANGQAFYDDERYLVVRKYVSGSKTASGGTSEKPSHLVPIERKKGYHRVYVGNLPWECTPDMVRSWFVEVGCTIKFLRLGTDKEGNFRGFAHLHFASDEDVDKALELNGEYMEGRQVKISPAVPPKR